MDAMVVTLWNVLLTAFAAFVAFEWKTQKAEMHRLTVLLNKTREEVARDYLAKEEADRKIDQILARFDRLEAKLDRYLEQRN
jgi:hypothetical protein